MMRSFMQHPAALPILLISLPCAAMGLYIAYLIVPEIVAAIVPAVVEKVVGGS